MTTASSNAIDTPPSPTVKGLEHGGQLTDFVREVSLPLHLGNKTTAAQLVANFLGDNVPVKTEAHAHAILQSFLQYLLDGNRYVDAATLLWPPSLFSGEPQSAKTIFDEAFKSVALALQGAASMGKTYVIGVYAYLDWRRDPEYTNYQFVGPSEKHLERNLFTHLVKLHVNASIPGPGDVRQLEITSDPKEKSSGLFGVVVPTGKKASGRLQGVKVIPRRDPHPQFGKLSRLRVVLEEAENIPPGIFEDVTNILSNARGLETFKIFANYNPKDPNSQVALRAEPKEGWQSIDLETSTVWDSKRGWRVVRLDAYKSENVLQGQEIFVGLQTKEGLDHLIRNAGGVGTPGYFTMARGWYPPTGVDLAVVPLHLMNDIYGTFEFMETPRPVGALDVALEGGDNAIFCLGRFGVSNGWRRPPIDGKEQPFQAFKDPSGRPYTREVLQIDQIFKLPKGDTVKLVEETIKVCNGAYVKGNGLAVDRTGNGAGVHDLLVRRFGPAVGINPSSSPTEKKILDEDQALPSDEYQYLLTELWFGLRKFVEFGFVKMRPEIPRDPLFEEVTGRRFTTGGKKMKVESKKDYKSRGNKSPDRADALTMLVFVVRQLMHGAPSSVRQVEFGPQSPFVQRISCIDRMQRL